MRARSGERWRMVLLLAAAAAWCAAAGPGAAQGARQKPDAALPDYGKPLRKPDRKRKADPRAATQGAAAAAAPLPASAKETVEADVSTRTIAVTSAFTGTEIVVFGSVVNSRQPSAEAGYYDVIVVLEGMATPLTVRRKANVAGLWICLYTHLTLPTIA